MKEKETAHKTSEAKCLTRSDLLRAQELELAAVEEKLNEQRRAIKRKCTDAVAQAARERDIARDQVRAERLRAVGAARSAHDTRLTESEESMQRAIEAVDRAAEKALAAARDRYEQVSGEQSTVLHREMEAHALAVAAALEGVRKRHAAEVAAYDAAEKQKDATGSQDSTT